MSLIKNLWLKPTVLLVLLLKYKVNIIARSISLMLSLTENHKNQYIKLQKKDTLSGTP